MKSSILTTAGLLLMFFMVGCGKLPAPKDEQAEAEWTLVTLHVGGFQKSKSGAT